MPRKVARRTNPIAGSGPFKRVTQAATAALKLMSDGGIGPKNRRR